jgi:hypothetical protein
MNVLLAEADVPYTQLKEMDEINPEFAQTDVALVIGANDVINPAARRPGNAVSGMPILDVDQAKNIIVIKRSRATATPASTMSCTSTQKRACFLCRCQGGARRDHRCRQSLGGGRMNPLSPPRANRGGQ